MASYILYGLLLSVHLCSCAALQCFQCDRVADPRDCHQLVTCGSHEQCFSQKFVGSNLAAYYSFGCINSMVCQQMLIGKRDNTTFTETDVSLYKAKVNEDQKSTVQENNNAIFEYSHALHETVMPKTGKRAAGDIAVCSQCCNSDNGCNARMCGAVQASTLRCISCHDVIDPADCNTVQDCSLDHYCYVNHGLSQSSLNIRYEMGCMSELQCKAFSHIFSNHCVKCCNTSLCNLHACDTAPTTQTTTTTTTTTSTTTTTTTTTLPPTTTPAPKVVINGPSQNNLLASVILQCLTVPAAQQYRWQVNGSNNLPRGVTATQMSTVSGSSYGAEQLTINSLDESTFGTYTCTAFTNGHVIQTSHFIGIIPAPPTVTLHKNHSTNYYALDCLATGYPAPILDWDFRPATVGEHKLPPGIEYIDNGRESVVSIHAYKPTYHDGVWICIATNSLGAAHGQTTIP